MIELFPMAGERKFGFFGYSFDVWADREGVKCSNLLTRR